MFVSGNETQAVTKKFEMAAGLPLTGTCRTVSTTSGQCWTVWFISYTCFWFNIKT